MEGGRSLVVVGTLLDIICRDLLRRDVAILETDALIGALEEDALVFQELQGLDTRRVGEELIAVEAILVSRDAAILRTTHHQFEHIREEVHLRAYGLFRIVEAGIGIVVQVYLTIDIAAPHHVLRHRCLRGERQLCTGGHRVGIRLLSRLLLPLLRLLVAPLLRLGGEAQGDKVTK